MRSLSRSGIASPLWEKGGVFSLENADRTRCMVRRMFFIVTQERPFFRFFQIHSFTESIEMCRGCFDRLPFLSRTVILNCILRWIGTMPAPHGLCQMLVLHAEGFD